MSFRLAGKPLTRRVLQSRRLAGISFAAVCLAGVAVSGEADRLSGIAEREVQRRQALVQQAQAQLAEAATLYKADKFQEATSLYSDIYQSLPNAAMATPARDQARAGLAAATCAWARQLMNEARYAEAAQALDSLLAPAVDPDNVEAKQLKKEFADTDRYPAALTPVHIANVKKVQELLQLAASCHEIGDFDRAIENYKAALRIDAFNTASRRGLEKAEQARAAYFEAARDHTRAKQLTEVDSLWEQPVPPSAADLNAIFGANEEARATLASSRNDIVEKLRTMMIPKLDFSGATLEEVVEYLRIRSRDLDPKGRGVDFVLNLPPESRSRLINLSLENVPLEDVLRYVTQMGGAAYRVEERAVMIVSLTEKSTQMVSRSYRVPPNFIQTAPVDAAATPAGQDPFANAPQTLGGGGIGLRRIGAKEFLETRGVVFPEGASAAYNAATSTLTIRNTVDNIAIVDSLVDQALGSAPKQVIVSLKIMDISQDNLNELGFDWLLGQFNLPGSERVFGSGGTAGNQQSPDFVNQDFPIRFPGGGGIPVGENPVTSSLRSSGAILGKPSIDGLIGAVDQVAVTSRSPGTLALSGVLTDPQFQVVLRAMNQRKGIDLVTVPSVITKSGVKATVVAAREFPYPTEFDPPEIPQNVDLGGTIAINGATGSVTQSVSGTVPITPTTPTAFEVRDVGITLDVEPIISEDGREVEVSLSPQSTEFEGFIDYGSDITNSSNFSTFDPVAFAFNNSAINYNVDNPIIQPVFRVDKLTTSVKIWDGSTIVLGGVTSETKTDINDKVPIIGDIPVIGRLWQSKVTKTQQKVVLFFVTVKVIDSSGKPIRQEGRETVAR